MWYDGRSRDGKEGCAVKKRIFIALGALAAVLAAVFLALVLPGLTAGKETAPSPRATFSPAGTGSERARTS